jgi:hypothetical protein
MSLTYLSDTPSERRDPEPGEYVLVFREESVMLFKGDEKLTEFDLGPYALFRPDHDSMHVSKAGAVWRPVRGSA